MTRKHIPVHEVRTGTRIFVVPRDKGTPRGPKLEPIPAAGAPVVVSEYIHGCIQRGALVAYELAEPKPATPAKEAPPPAPEELPAGDGNKEIG